MATYTITLTAIIKGKKYDTEWTNLSINKFNKRCELYSFRAPIFILKFQQMQQHHPYLLYCQKLYSNVTAKNLATCTHARTSFSSACGYHTLPHQRSRPHHEPIYHLCLMSWVWIHPHFHQPISGLTRNQIYGFDLFEFFK